MAGKRILDAAALLSASRAIAVNHFRIRLQQVDLYSKTSSLARLIRSDPRGNIALSAFQQFSQAAVASSQAGKPHFPGDSTTGASGQSQYRTDGISQGHFFDRSKENSTSDPVPDDDLQLHQRQAQHHPLPDGTIPPEGSKIEGKGDPESFYERSVVEAAPHAVGDEAGQNLRPTESSRSSIPEPNSKPHSAEELKILQRQSEGQIPAQPANPPGTQEDEDHDLHVDQEHDVYTKRPGESGPVLSGLPRMKVPKVEADVQGWDEHIPEKVNSDVFYSAKSEEKGPSGTDAEPSEEMMNELFHSKKVARLLSKKSSNLPSGVKRAYHSSARRLQKHEPTIAEKQEMQKLANDMTKEANAVSKTL